MEPTNHINEPNVEERELHDTNAENPSKVEQTNETQAAQEEPNLETEVAELRERCAELADKNLRMMAEFDNFRRRTAKEKLDLQKTAGENIFRDMLPLIDDFERAVDAMQKTDDIHAVRDGVNLIYQKFMTFLEKNEVRPIDTNDAEFNTEYHEAVTLFPATDDSQKGHVIDCLQRGYTLGDKVIRYAKVVVAQ